MAILAYQSFDVFLRIYDKRVITEEGIYAENAVPTDYAGPELTVEYDQILVLGDSSGSIQEIRKFDYADVMDQNRQKGVGYTYEFFDNVFLEAAKGPSTLIATWYPLINPELDDWVVAKLSTVLEINWLERGYLPPPP